MKISEVFPVDFHIDLIDNSAFGESFDPANVVYGRVTASGKICFAEGHAVERLEIKLTPDEISVIFQLAQRVAQRIIIADKSCGD